MRDWTLDLPEKSVAEATRGLIAQVAHACDLDLRQARRAVTHALSRRLIASEVIGSINLRVDSERRKEGER